MEDEETLLEIKRVKNHITSTCTISNPFDHMEVIMIISEIRDNLIEKIEDFIKHIPDMPGCPESLKTLIKEYESTSQLSNLVEKITDMDKEQKDQFFKDMKGLMSGK